MSRAVKGGAINGDRKFCGRCKRWKPLDAFYPIHNRGWRVTGCFACAQERMAMWARTPNVGKKPDSIREIAE